MNEIYGPVNATKVLSFKCVKDPSSNKKCKVKFNGISEKGGSKPGIDVNITAKKTININSYRVTFKVKVSSTISTTTSSTIGYEKSGVSIDHSIETTVTGGSIVRTYTVSNTCKCIRSISERAQAIADSIEGKD
jgi:hypothetical protein